MMRLKNLIWLGLFPLAFVLADESTCLIPDYYAELAIQAHQQHLSLAAWQKTSLKPYADSPQIKIYLNHIAIKAFQMPPVLPANQQRQLHEFVWATHQQCLYDFRIPIPK